MPRVFICYRREDSGGYAGRIYDRLASRYGHGEVFMDTDTLAPGEHWVEVIPRTVRACDVVVAVIGRKWATVSDESGSPRLHHPDDFVRLELRTALENNVAIIPVLVTGAEMPPEASLPEDLRPILTRQALAIHEQGFREDVDSLIRAINASSRSGRFGGFFSDRRRLWRVGRALVAVLAAVLVISLVFSRLGHLRSDRRPVAVLGFRNVTGKVEAAWVSTALAEGIRNRLAGNGKIRTVPGQDVSDMSRDLGITQFDSLGKSTLARVHRFGVELVVLGSYTDLNGHIALNVELQDAERQATVDSLQAEGEESDLNGLVAQVGARLRGKLGVGELSPDRERQLAAAQPQPEAAPFYAEGLANLRLYDAIDAQRLLSKAALADPKFPFVHYYLAHAWHILGYDSRAGEEASRAFDLSSKLALEDRLIVEGGFREMSHDWAKATAIYDQLYHYAPDRLDYALALARTQRLGGQLKAALDGLASLQQTKTPNAADPRIDLEKAESAAALGDYGLALNSAETAAGKARDLGAGLLEARALYWKCASLNKQRKLEEAQPACVSAAQRAQSIGDRLGMARALNGLGNCLREKGDLPNAAKQFEEAVRITDSIGTKLDESGALNNLAIVLMKQGKGNEAEATYRKALAIQQEIGVKSEQAKTANNLCQLLADEEEWRKAEATCRTALDLATKAGNKKSLAIALDQLSWVEEKRGRASEAATLREKARQVDGTPH